MSLWGQAGLQEGSSVMGVEIQSLYDHAMLTMGTVLVFVMVMVMKLAMNKFFCSKYLDNQWLETLWTIFPVCLLLLLGLPSIKLLYLMDELDMPEATVKVIGHQWYWSYEYSDSFGSTYSFDSYMEYSGEGEMALKSTYRLLEVNNRCVVASLLPMRVLVTSEDVVHSWSIPSAGIKVDGIPGRINQVGLYFIYTGVFYGQCSELCGVNHSYMPVCVEAVSIEAFTDWIFGNHSLNSNNNSNSSNWFFSGVSFIWGCICKVGGCFYILAVGAGSLYVWWWKKFFYYGMYLPLKFTLTAGWGLVKWATIKCLLLGKWVVWFLISPIDASVYAVTYVVQQIYGMIWFAVTKPIEFSSLLAKSMYSGVHKTVLFIVQGSVFLYNAMMMSMSSFVDDEFKKVVVERVSSGTRKFLWIVQEYYKNR
uniref:Cytochrome c oxidase subunit 2 n=1 Tax=Utterbackia peninsularis TaxID=872316 RepID=F4ZG71_9BIVA|nr:cytochrome c oxidase subunit II [Utterbackia peninsularis]ADL62592.1 cytochrome c oxidase subunit II [Utterbackia peninsularis]